MEQFENRELLIVTKHGKEQVLKPLLEASLGVKCVLNTDFDTDTFGTFSGEIDRKDDSLTTVRKKCLATMLYHNSDLAVASEGSFGPHPSSFFATADDELVIFIDVRNKIEVIGRKVSCDTNFASRELTSLNDLYLFLEQVKFPSHKIILKNPAQKSSEIHKDIATEQEAVLVFNKLLKKYKRVQAETDMRAMNNPTRMNVIKEAAENMIYKLTSLCPRCDFPGFSVSDSVTGLLCRSCNIPTRSILYNVLTCTKCSYEEKKYYPQKKLVEDPMYCDTCNP